MLDGGPSRKFRTVERSAAERPAAVRRQPEETSQTTERPSAHNSPEAQPIVSYQERRPRRLRQVIMMVVLLIIVVSGGWMLWSRSSSTQGKAAIEKDKYQAVFMAGGQVYFGKLEVLGDSYLKLSNVFYIQSNASSSETGNEGKDPQTNNTDNNMQLIKLGEEVHGPEDAMIINRDQLLFYENLKPDGKVSQLIQNYKSK